MKRKYVIFVVSLTLCGFMMLSSCGGSSTGPGNGGSEDEAPTSPTNLSGDSGDLQIQLNWEANDEDDLDGYNLYRDTESFSSISEMDPVNGSDLLNGTVYDDTDVENGTTYYYRVTAVDENDNESEISSELEITPFSDPPDRPN